MPLRHEKVPWRARAVKCFPVWRLGCEFWWWKGETITATHGSVPGMRAVHSHCRNMHRCACRACDMAVTGKGLPIWL